MSPALANFLFEAANFLLLAALLGWVLFKPVRRALDAERVRHEAELHESQRLRAEAEVMAEQTRHARQVADLEIEQHRQEILGGAKQEASQLLTEARNTERAERRALELELEAVRTAEATELAGAVGGLAAEAVRNLIEALPGPSIDTMLIRAACEALDSIPAEARRSAHVESARPLDTEGKRLLEGALGSEFKERVVPELGAGVRVTTPAGQVDASALSLARHAGGTVTRLGTELGGQRSPGGSHA